MGGKQARVPDLCVIGASEAGMAACMGAAALGLSVTLIDDGHPDHRDSPDLVLDALRSAADKTPGDWPDLRRALDLAEADRHLARLAAMNVTVIRAHAHFIDQSTVMAGDGPIQARRFILATGGRQPLLPMVAGLRSRQWSTLHTSARLVSRPGSVLVLGGTGHALSAAQSFSRLRVDTILVAEALLPSIDPELAAPVLRQLRRDGVIIESGVRAQTIQSNGTGVQVLLSNGDRREAEQLLLAEAPVPALDGLDLACAGIARHGDGLMLNRANRTTNPRVFALGCAGGAASTAAGLNHVGRVLRSALLPGLARVEADCPVTFVPTEPEIVTVGLSEEAAAKRGAVRVWRWPLAHTGGGTTPSGQIKVVTDRRDRVLGVGMVGSGVREMAAFWALVVERRMALPDLATLQVPVPSRAEAVRALAVAAMGRRLTNPWVGRALRAARWLG